MNEAEKPSQGTKTGLGVAGSVILSAKLRVSPNILSSDISPACFAIIELPREITPCKRDIFFNSQMHETPVVLQKCPIVAEPRCPWLARCCCVALTEL